MQNTNITLCCLGAPRLETGGQLVEIGKQKALALLIYLGVTGVVHHREKLATLFWPDSSTARARSYLRDALWILKNALGEEHFHVTRQTIQLKRGPALRVDSEEFRHLVEIGLKSDDANGIDCLVQAAALYQDDFCSGFTLPDCPGFDEWHYFQREELRRTYGLCLQRLASAYAQQGEIERAIAHAQRWLHLDPLDESTHRLLMELHAGAGQHTAALRQYRECVRILREELGVTPSTETKILVARIRSGLDDKMTSIQRVPEEDKMNSTGHPVTLSSGHPVTTSPSHNLPPQSIPFVGRTQELSLLAQRMAEPTCRLLTILGPGGVGKTRLAIEFARSAPVSFAAGIHFVDLAPLPSADLLATTLLSALLPSIPARSDPETQLLRHLRHKQVLIILDNYEQLLPDTDLVATLFADLPNAKFLVTARQRLHLQDEWLLPLRGLTVPPIIGAGRTDADALVSRRQMERADSVQLFLQLVRRVAPDFVPSQDDLTAIVAICRLLEGMPLPLELAAAWVRFMPAADIAAEIRRDLDFLSSSLQGLSLRHQSMRAVFDHSWRLLSHEERIALRQLAIFRKGFERNAARTVTDASLPLLSGLVDKSWLQVTSGGRYRMHELVRQYGLEKLRAARGDGASTAERAVRAAHARYFADRLAEQALILRNQPQEEAMAGMLADVDNVRAAWHWAVAEQQWALVDAMVEGLYWVWHAQGWYRELDALAAEAVEILQSLIAHHEPPTTAPADVRLVLAKVLYHQAAAAHTAGSPQKARSLQQQALSLFDQPATAPEKRIWANLLQARGWVLYHEEKRQAEQSLRQALAIHEEVSGRWEVATTEMVLGSLLASQGNDAEGRTYLEHCLDLCRVGGFQRIQIYASVELARILCSQGEPFAARDLLRETRPLVLARQDEPVISSYLEGVDALCAVMDLDDAERQLLNQWLDRLESTELPLIPMRLHRCLGRMHKRNGNVAAAARHFQESLAIARAVRRQEDVDVALVCLGQCALQQQQTARAVDLFRTLVRDPTTTRRAREQATALLAEIEDHQSLSSKTA